MKGLMKLITDFISPFINNWSTTEVLFWEWLASASATKSQDEDGWFNATLLIFDIVL